MQKISRGNVYYYDLGQYRDGSVENKCRPVLVVSNDCGNKFGTTCIIAPITTRTKESCKKWQVWFENENNQVNVILLEQLRCVNSDKLGAFIGRVDDFVMQKVDVALSIEFDLDITERQLSQEEYLNRLDGCINSMLQRKLTNFEKMFDTLEKRFSENVEKVMKNIVLQTTNIETFMSNITKQNELINSELQLIKSKYNENALNIDKVLSSLISLYKQMDADSFTKVTKTDMPKVKEVDKDVDKDNANTTPEITISDDKQIISKKRGYTVDSAKQVLIDYDALDIKDFMSKYNCVDKNQVMNKRTSALSYLKKQGVSTDKFKHKTRGASKPVTNNTTNNQSIKSTGKKGMLQFVKDCNTLDNETVCSKYGLTKKQLSNRKWLTKQYLKELNIECEFIDRRKSNG